MPRFVRQLRAWQFREWLYSAIVATAGMILFITLGVTLACLVDFLIDRRVDTPQWVRIPLTLIQVAIYMLTFIVILRFLKVPSLVTLAMRAEEAIPQLGHRLVTTMQLTHVNAKTDGMSKELIGIVSVEAEDMANQHKFASLASTKRVWIALILLMPVWIVLALAFLVWGHYSGPLLLRQAFINADIPHQITVEDATTKLWPSGDSVELRFRVSGPNADGLAGTISVWPKKNEKEYLPREQYEAKFVGLADDGSATYSVQVPPSTQEFEYRARFRDKRWFSLNHGRMKSKNIVKFEPRPVVQSIDAWAILPSYVDPDGKKNYEQFMPQAEVATHADSSVRVNAKFTKPVVSASLLLHGRDNDGNQIILRKLPMELSESGKEADLKFDLKNNPFAYAIEIVDSNGFANLSPPRRGINILPDSPPRVELLDELFRGGADQGPDEAYEIRGCPIPMGGLIQFGYRAKSSLGIAEAAVSYRVNDGQWQFFKLQRVVADESKVGRFLPNLGIFEKYNKFLPVEFYMIPTTNPESEPDGLAVGGRYNFQVSAMTKYDTDGTTLKPLEVGDRVEFYVVAYDRKPGLRQAYTDRMGPGRPPGASESRIKTVVNQAQLREWDAARLQSQERLRRLEELQRGVFGQKAPK
jgi:hypothetical protein